MKETKKYLWYHDKGFFVFVGYTGGSMLVCDYLDIPPVAWFVFAWIPFLIMLFYLLLVGALAK